MERTMTIYDIAREAGVSISTVSRVINNKTTVDPLLKERVDEVLKKHNYQPNAIARGLATRSLKTVGVLLPDIRDLHYASIAYQIEQDLRTVDFNMIISNAGTNHESFAESLDMLAKRSVDGIILIGSLFMNEATVLALSTLADTVPVVYANGFLRLDSVGSVAVDIESGVRQAITHLHERGHRSIAYLGFSDTYSGKKKR
ncbi:MAG: LacI family transcriptional regulator, partial [Spirochaetales bacterium]|nr:LacI family transcriptional regulator [Spirochaetales bacterium]